MKQIIVDNQVTDYFNSIGNVVHSKYGDVIINRTGIKSSVAHGIGRNKAIAFKAVPDVIENGEIIDYQLNYKKRGYDSAVFAAPIKINNQPYFVAVVVRVEADNNSYYLHELALTKKEDATPFKTGTDQVGTPSGETSSIYSLLETLQKVNNDESENVKFSLKEPAEETKDLIAVHNITTANMHKALDLGGFYEIAYVVIPDNADDGLKSALSGNGIEYREYEAGNEQSRVDVLNSLDDVKFSRKEKLDEFDAGDYNLTQAIIMESH